jgi:hypothetical protein
MPLHLFIAHAFGQVYNLPVPLWLYLYTGAAAIVLSFLVVSYFVEAKPAAPRGFTLPGQFTGLIATLRAVSLLLFALILVCGLFGVQLPLNNFATTFFWVIFYLGATYLAAVFGNLWDFVNPLKVVVRGVEKITHTTFEPRLPYPRWLGYWPAFAFYFGFIWLELLSAGFGIVPLNIAGLLMMYTLVTLCGSVVFGRERWFDQAEAPTIFLRLVARLAPFHWDKGRVQLRPPLVGLLDNTPKPLSLMVFVVFMLASTAFDGLKETKAFAAIYNQLATLPGLGHLPYQALATLILALAPLLFLAAYWLCMIAIVPITGTHLRSSELASRFAFTLVPIAVAYHAAHYFTLLLIQGQSIIRLASDPFGRGWNLFHTAGYTTNVGLVGAATVWYTQVALIVLGHIAAVYLAHRVALKVFPATKQALLSQYPMLALMVAYTMTSLWIIAQPITKG